MLPDPIRALVREEQARQQNGLVEGVDLDQYLEKLGTHAEILSDCADGRCRGFVAFYCNDMTTKQAFITLIVVDPRDRQQGVGRTLVNAVLELARGRGFTSCRLEVGRLNDVAESMYESLGFRLIESRGSRKLLEVAL
jgi:ribosomal protein S18 acetylase RimI-like enzyme